VELSDLVVGIVLVLATVAIALAVGCLRDFYGLSVRVYERNLDDSYLHNFQARSTVARTLNANVRHALWQAQQAVAEARKGVTDVTETRAALDQVSQWLNSAAATSARALRSLEDTRFPGDQAETISFLTNDTHEHRYH
jgi:hypothetical protein